MNKYLVSNQLTLARFWASILSRA